MRTLIIFLSVLSMGVILGSCNQNSKDKSRGGNSYDDGILCSPSIVYDFGEISVGSVDSVDFSFQIRNQSANVLMIEKIESSCSCIQISQKVTKLDPKEDFLIRGKVGIHNYNGKFNKPIFLTYGEGKLMLFRIKGRVLE